MTEELMIRHAAPTLAGLKTGSLFSCHYEDKTALYDNVRRFNRILVPRGMRIIPLLLRRGRALIYLYRPERLKADLSRDEAVKLLADCGYLRTDGERSIVELINRLKKTGTFPHEIGLFLSYPVEDVKGFMLHRGRNSKYTGDWKVYGDTAGAIRQFHKYRKCKEVYSRVYASGTPLERLAVAG